MTSSRLPYPWKIVVATAVIAMLIVGKMEISRRWSKDEPAPVEEASPSTTSGLYKDTLARVQEVIAAHTNTVPEIVRPGMKMVDLGVDPLTRVEVADSLESAYRIELTTEELAATVTVNDLVQLVVKKQQSAPIRIE